MRKLYLSIILLFAISQISFGQNVWINEFHYANTGADAGEFIEIVLQNANDYDDLGLSDFRIALYNSDGARYGVYHVLNTFTVGGIDPVDASFTYFYKNISGLQNGPADGFSLDYNGTVIQFISYNGTTTATEGPANGLTSTDIGVKEDDATTPSGYSLQLSGSGTQYSDFSWNSPAPATKGSPNISQLLPVELISFTANALGKGVMLNWSTATEVNNYGFSVERKSSFAYQNESGDSFNKWQEISFIEGHGNSNSPKDYSFVDSSPLFGEVNYRLKQIDTDGAFEYSDVVTVTAINLANYELYQNHPNPFNPSTTITFSLAEIAHVKITVYNSIGQKVVELANEQMDAGSHSVNFDASSLSTGFYFYRIETPNYSKTMKMMLIK